MKPGKGCIKNGFKSIWMVSILILFGMLGFFIFESEIASLDVIIYVDESNLGFEDGSPTNPFNTIQEGVDAASNRDTVYVFNGIYLENIEIINKSINLFREDKGIFISRGSFQIKLIDNPISHHEWYGIQLLVLKLRRKEKHHE